MHLTFIPLRSIKAGDFDVPGGFAAGNRGAGGMNMTLGDLRPYQKQNSYYKGIQLGKDVSKQAELINNSTRELIATQIASTNAISSRCPALDLVIPDEDVDLSIIFICQSRDNLLNKNQKHIGYVEFYYQPK